MMKSIKDMDKNEIVVRKIYFFFPHQKDEILCQNWIYDTISEHFQKKFGGNIKAKFFRKHKIDVLHDVRERVLWITVKKKKIGNYYKY